MRQLAACLSARLTLVGTHTRPATGTLQRVWRSDRRPKPDGDYPAHVDAESPGTIRTQTLVQRIVKSLLGFSKALLNLPFALALRATGFHLFVTSHVAKPLLNVAYALIEVALGAVRGSFDAKVAIVIHCDLLPVRTTHSAPQLDVGGTCFALSR